jgi:hypothetical protein
MLGCMDDPGSRTQITAPGSRTLLGLAAVAVVVHRTHTGIPKACGAHLPGLKFSGECRNPLSGTCLHRVNLEQLARS